jgi:hypothetical protein
MRGAALAVVLAAVSTLVALGAFASSAGATCAAGAQYDQYGNACPGGSGGSQYTPGSGGSQYDQYTPPGSGGSQYQPPPPPGPPSFTIGVDQPQVTVHAGGHFDEHVAITPANGFAGEVNFFTSDTDGGYSAPSVQIYVNPWPSPLTVTAGPVSWDLHSDVNPFVARGDYTIYYAAWANGAPSSWTPVTIHVLAALPRAYAKDVRTQIQSFGSDTDSVASDAANPNGSRHWRAELWNFCGNPLDVPSPQIQLSQPAVSWAFEPPVTFPLVQTLGHDLTPCNQLQLGAIDGYDSNTNQQSSSVQHQRVVAGYDGQRAMSTTTVPPGGLDQTLTTTITLRDPRYLHGFANIEVSPNWYGSGAASIDTASVTQGGITDESPSYWQFGTQNVSWTVNNAKLDTPYTLTLHIHIPNDGTASFQYKPYVALRGGWDTFLSPADATPSTTIADDALQSVFTFSAGAPVDWQRDVGDMVETQLQPVLAPPYVISVAQPTLHIHQGDTVSQDATVTPVNGFTGNLNFFLSGAPANGNWTQLPDGIYPTAQLPQNVPVGPTGTADVPLQIHIESFVAPGTYTVAVAGYGSNTPMQFGTFTVEVLPAVPQASAGDSRVSTISTTGDAFGATQSAPATLTFNPYILLRNPGSGAVLHAPSITATSSLTFAPPVGMPHTESGTDLAGPRTLFEMTALSGDVSFSGSTGNSRSSSPAVSPGFDLSRSATPASIPAAGGTQTVTVSLTARRPSGFATITIDPASIVPGATVDPSSVVPPAADPTGAADTQVGAGNGSVTWSTLSAAVDTTYTLTVTVHVPAEPGTRLFKPAVTGEVEWVSILGTETATSTSTTDSVLGGTIAYSSTGAVQWTRRLLDTVDVKLAGASTPVASVDHFVVRSSTKRIGTGTPFTVTVTAKNDRDRTVTAYTGPVALDDTAHTLARVGPIAWSDGVGTATVTLRGPLDTDRITATDTGDSPAAAGASGNIVVIGPTTQFKVATESDTTTVGAPFQVTVRALDALGRLVVDYAGPVTFGELSTGHEDAIIPSAEAWTAGVDTATLSLPTPSRSARIVVGTTGGLASGASRALVVLGPVTQLKVKVGPGTVVAHSGVLTVTSTALDAAGNVIGGFADPLSYVDLNTPPAVHVVAAGTWDEGVLVAKVTIGTSRAGDTITARSTADTSIAGTSNAFTVR